jgi:leucyl aminopeptidase
MLLGNKFKLSLLAILSTLAFSAHAVSANKYVVIAPQCLLKSSKASYKSLSTFDKLSLVKVDETGFNKLIEGKVHQKQVCGGFQNVTDAWKENQSVKHVDAKTFLKSYAVAAPAHFKLNYSLNHPKEVAQLMSELNPQNMWNSLLTLSSYTDRYANSDNGVAAANWFKSQIEDMAKNNNRTDVTITLVDTGSSYKQPSVVVKIGNSTKPGIVVGGHMDTLSSSYENKPGADDDGTGSVTVLEVARTLLASNLRFNKPIYLIWYSAEEEGLVGSGYVVKYFKTNNIPVENVMHMDMTGYMHDNDPTMWLMDDYTNPALTSYFETLITTYVKQKVKHSSCGYACSDHATWTQNGYNSAIAFETEMDQYDPYIHTANDTMEVLSLEHMKDYAKLAMAFVGELADPISSKS